MTKVRDIVVIGASVGGLDAISRLAAGLQRDLQASLFIVIHTAPTSPRMTADLIGRRTPLKVCYGAQGLQAEHGHIYIAPPDHHMTIVEPSYVHLDQGPKEWFHRPAANPLFRSAARAFGRRVIGIILTGGNGDGAAGMAAVSESGGIGIVQEPNEAKNPSMPRAALQAGDPAYRVPINEMAHLLVQLVNGIEFPLPRDVART